MTTRRNVLRTATIDDAGGPSALEYRRGTTVKLLLRRCGKLIVVTTHRSSRVAWHAAVSRFRGLDADQAGVLSLQLRLALEELGPTFVKLGQLFSARSDIVSPQIQRELSTLRDHAPSIPHVMLVEELERSFGPELRAHFETLDMVPVACGSIAQVHRGTLPNGLHVAVKVRRPGVRTDIEADVRLLGKLVRLAAFLSSRVRAYDPVAILDEFATLLYAETDFTIEADNIGAIRRTFSAGETVIVPRVVTELSSESVLVMDWIEGTSLSNRERLDAVGVSRSGLARAILQAYGMMIFQSDRFQADPHPGNLIAIEGGQLGLIDFGEVGSLSGSERTALLQMLAAILGRDSEALAGAVLSVSRTTRAVDHIQFAEQLAALLDPVADSRLKDIGLGKLLARILHLLRNHGIVLPSDLAILIKTMIECEATTDELDSTMSMLELVGEFGFFAPPAQTMSTRTSSDESSDEERSELPAVLRRMNGGDSPVA
jgi:ubiquinone biosynthesis protein